MAATTIAIEMEKCDHFLKAQHYMKVVANKQTAQMIFEDLHPKINEKTHNLTCMARTHLQDSISYEVDLNLPLQDILKFGAHVLRFKCCSLPLNAELLNVEMAVEEAKGKAIDAFQVLMSGGRKFPEKKTSSSSMKSGLSSKDVLYNDVVGLCEKLGADFPKATAELDGKYFVQVLCNALWYVTNQINTINETAQRQKDVVHVPELFDKFSGYNDIKRKKAKSQPMSAQALKGHAEALFTLLCKPYVNSSTGKWPVFKCNIESFAVCLMSYKNYLDTQVDKCVKNQNLPHPPRTVDTNASVLHFKQSVFLNQKYVLLDKAVTESDEPILFNEETHVDKPFDSSVQRHRFFQNLHLSVPVDVVQFTPGGGVGTTFILFQVPENRSEAAMMTDAARLVQKMRPQLKEYHTRAQKREFKRKVANIARIQPSLVDFIYSELWNILKCSNGCG